MKFLGKFFTTRAYIASLTILVSLVTGCAGITDKFIQRDPVINYKQDKYASGSTFTFDIDVPPGADRHMQLIESMPSFQTGSDFVAVIKMQVLRPFYIAPTPNINPYNKTLPGWEDPSYPGTVLGFVVNADNVKWPYGFQNQKRFNLLDNNGVSDYFNGLGNLVAVRLGGRNSKDEARQVCDGVNGPNQYFTDAQPSFYCNNIDITLWKRGEALQISYFDHRTAGVAVVRNLRPDSLSLVARAIHTKGKVEFIFPGNPSYANLEAKLIERWDKRSKVSLEDILFSAVAAYGAMAIVGAADCLVGGNKYGSCGGSSNSNSSDSSNEASPSKDKTVKTETSTNISQAPASQTSTDITCGIEGTASHPSGTKRHNDSTISTSWNSKTAIPMNGRYELDLGKNACGEKITVFAKGMTQAEVRLPKKGNAHVNLIYDDSGYRR